MRKYIRNTLILMGMVLILYHPGILSDEHYEEKDNSSGTVYSRNDFTRDMAASPYTLSWTSRELVERAFYVAEEKSPDIRGTFDQKISLMPGDASYYAAAYELSDHVRCQLLWIVDNESPSLGVELSGPVDTVKDVEDFLLAKLGNPGSRETVQDSVVTYWLGKKYCEVEYVVTSKESMQKGENIGLEIVIHPQIYH